MPDAIYIHSKDADFAQTLAEQLAGMASVTQDPHAAQLVVATEGRGDFACPVLVVGEPPLRMQALLADIQAVLQGQKNKDFLTFGSGFTLAIRQKQLGFARKTVDLTDKEAQLLQCLAADYGKIAAKEALLKTVWGIESALDTHTLETHIYRLRNKFRELGEEDMVIAAEGGYRLKD